MSAPGPTSVVGVFAHKPARHSFRRPSNDSQRLLLAPIHRQLAPEMLVALVRSSRQSMVTGRRGTADQADSGSMAALTCNDQIMGSSMDNSRFPYLSSLAHSTFSLFLLSPSLFLLFLSSSSSPTPSFSHPSPDGSHSCHSLAPSIPSGGSAHCGSGL
jgi:hypothetical protein